MAVISALVVCSTVVLATWGAPIPILQKFEWTPGVVTYGNDDRTVEDVDTADGCAALCLQEATFICKSFDFRSKEKVCMLSKGNSYTAGVGLRLAAGADLYELLPDYIPTDIPTTARPTAAKPTDPTTPGEGKDDLNTGGLKDQPSAEPMAPKRKSEVGKTDNDKDEDSEMADGKVTNGRRKDRRKNRKKNRRGKANGEDDIGKRGRKRGRQGRRNGDRKKNRKGKGRNGGSGKRPSQKMDKETDVKNTNDVSKTSTSPTVTTTVPRVKTTPEPAPYQTPSPLDSEDGAGATAVTMTTEIVPLNGDTSSETPNSIQDDVDVPDVEEGNTAAADDVTAGGPSVSGNDTEAESKGQTGPEQGLP